MLPPNLVLATHNPGKSQEFRQLCGAVQGLSDAADLGLPEPPEEEDSFLANAWAKATFACKATGRPALAEDAGLQLDALDGRPGVVTRRLADRLGGWEEAAAELQAEVGDDPPTGHYECALALVWPSGRVVLATGSAPGSLCSQRGKGDGLTPFFRPEGQERSWAELGAEWRAANDHRSLAFAELLRRL